MKPLPQFIAVVHVEKHLDTLRQVEKALSSGAGGIFLISHYGKGETLTQEYYRVRTAYPEAWVGINYLDYDALQAVQERRSGVDGLWFDASHVHSDKKEMELARRISEAAVDAGAGKSWRTFGSVAFKYQAHEPDPALAAHLAAELFDVVVTSGERTGSAPGIEKIREMRGTAGRARLALASGVTSENLLDFYPHVGCFMINTGISTSGIGLDPVKIESIKHLCELGAARGFINKVAGLPSDEEEWTGDDAKETILSLGKWARSLKK